jgi:hypothetical protein
VSETIYLLPQYDLMMGGSQLKYRDNFTFTSPLQITRYRTLEVSGFPHTRITGSIPAGITSESFYITLCYKDRKVMKV